MLGLYRPQPVNRIEPRPDALPVHDAMAKRTERDEVSRIVDDLRPLLVAALPARAHRIDMGRVSNILRLTGAGVFDAKLPVADGALPASQVQQLSPQRLADLCPARGRHDGTLPTSDSPRRSQYPKWWYWASCVMGLRFQRGGVCQPRPDWR